MPIKVHSATEDQTMHFHEVHVDDGARIEEHKRICPKEDKEVPYKRTRRFPAIVRARDGALRLTTMRFHDEVRATKDVPSASGKSRKPSKKELDTAVAPIEAPGVDWEPERYEDRYRKRLQKIVRDKGKTIEVPQEADSQSGAPANLMAVLKEALEAATK